MSDGSLQTFRRRYPEFSADDYTDGEVQAFINDARSELDPISFEGVYHEAVHALAAHLLKIASQSESPESHGLGSLTRVRTDTHAAQWAAPDPNDPLQTTKYGQQFRRLQRKAGGLTGDTV